MKLVKDERGLAGVLEVGLIGLVVVVIVFAGTRVYNATRSADQANQEAIKISQTSPDFEEANKLEEEKEEAKEEPKEEKEEPKTVAVVEQKPKPTEEDKDYKEIKITASASQDSEKVNISVSLGASYSGQCYIKLFKDGYDKVTKTITVSNSSSCAGSFDKDDIAVDGTWYVYADFRNSDKSVKGWDDTSINVTL